jgi:hypothetical protein
LTSRPPGGTQTDTINADAVGWKPDAGQYASAVEGFVDGSCRLASLTVWVNLAGPKWLLASVVEERHSCRCMKMAWLRLREAPHRNDDNHYRCRFLRARREVFGRSRCAVIVLSRNIAAVLERRASGADQ